MEFERIDNNRLKSGKGKKVRVKPRWMTVISKYAWKIIYWTGIKRIEWSQYFDRMNENRKVKVY